MPRLRPLTQTESARNKLETHCKLTPKTSGYRQHPDKPT